MNNYRKKHYNENLDFESIYEEEFFDNNHDKTFARQNEYVENRIGAVVYFD